MSVGVHFRPIPVLSLCLRLMKMDHQQTGQPMMFSPGGRDQWVYEGIVVALLYVGISAAVAVAYAAAGWKRCEYVFLTRGDVPCWRAPSSMC